MFRDETLWSTTIFFGDQMSPLYSADIAATFHHKYVYEHLKAKSQNKQEQRQALTQQLKGDANVAPTTQDLGIPEPAKIEGAVAEAVPLSAQVVPPSLAARGVDPQLWVRIFEDFQTLPVLEPCAF